MNYLGKELSRFSHQIRFALQQYTPHGIRREQLNNIVLCGLGGSGIAGQIIKNYFYDKIDIPVELVSDYHLPRFAGENSLVILCSYSGNTEETLSCYQQANERGCKIICITCGGQIEALAIKDNQKLYKAEPGFQPRVALGYPLTYYMLIFAELLGQNESPQIESVANMMDNLDDYKDESGRLLDTIKATIKNKFVIVADKANEGVAIRFANQIQENAKLEAFVVVLPEGNHNVIETYYSKLDTNYIFLNSGVNQRVNLRFHFLKELLTSFNSPIAEIIPKKNTLTHLVHLIYLLDWFSLQIANHVGAISNSIENINNLKKYLEKN